MMCSALEEGRDYCTVGRKVCFKAFLLGFQGGISFVFIAVEGEEDRVLRKQ